MTNADAHTLRIAEQESVVRVAENLLDHCHKKKMELMTLLEYRKFDLISGSEVQCRFERLVVMRIREKHGKRPFKPMPWAYSVGFHLSRKNIALLSHRLLPGLSEAQKQEARERHNVFGESITALSRLYGVSRSSVWRALKR